MDVKQVLAGRPSFLPPARLYRPGLLWIGDDRCHVTSKPGRLQHTGELGRLIAPRWTLLRARFVLPTQLSVHTPHPPAQRTRTCWWVRFACPTSLSPSFLRD